MFSKQKAPAFTPGLKIEIKEFLFFN